MKRRNAARREPQPHIRPLWRWLLAAALTLATALVVHMPKGLWQLLILAGAAILWIIITGLLTRRGATYFFIALGGGVALFTVFLAAMLANRPRLDMQIPVVRREVYAGKNVLVIVPHQDDELAVFGGVAEAFAGESQIHIAFVTTGDNGGDPAVRMREARAAAAEMGLPADALILLGYGNDWDTSYGHLYHAPPEEPLRSARGFRATYGTPEYPPFRQSAYTRANMRADLEALILELKPDTIFCVDYDNHPDHRAASMLFEEAMGRILAHKSGYTPAVYKGFSYSTGLNAAKDFYAPNILSTRLAYPLTHMAETNLYRWDARVRFIMADRALSRFLGRSSMVAAMNCYASQNIAHFKEFAVSGDRVFWQRDTGSLLYGAAVSASSGDAAALNDFCMEGTQDIMDTYRPPYDALWSPDADDPQRRATVALDAPVMMDELRFYDNPSMTDNVLSLRATLDDGTVLESGALEPDGTASILRFTPRMVRSFDVELTALEGARAGLVETEAYHGHRPEGACWIKLTDEADNFVYDYRLQGANTLCLGLYESPAAAGEGALDARYAVSVEGEGCRAAIDGTQIIANCPRGSVCTLTVRDLFDPALIDVVRLSNPRLMTGILIDSAQWADWFRDSLTMPYQLAYYGGICERLLQKL